MFVETFCNESVAFPSSSSKPAIPYPELAGEELGLWQRYLPIRTELENVPFGLHDNLPQLVIEQLEKARTAPYLFERIEIWNRSDDPMAVGVTAGEHPRYFSIARWGDAKLTLDQLRKILRMEEWMFRLVSAAMILIVLSGALGLYFQGWSVKSFCTSPGCVYPVPQNAPYVSAAMNVPNHPEGQRPKATDVSPWYGVYSDDPRSVTLSDSEKSRKLAND
jgi:hypothetical protein